MKKIGVILMMLSASPVFAQTYEEWVKQQKQGYAQFSQETQSGIQQLQKEYADYVAERDKEFAEYLKQRWEEYHSDLVEKPDSMPKPVDAPVVKDVEVKNSVVVLEDVMTDERASEETVVVPRIKITRSVKTSSVRRSFKFYGESLSIAPDRRMCVPFSGALQGDGFADYWSRMCATSYDELIDELIAYKERLVLNDWGYYMLVKGAALSMAGDENSVQLLTWFILNKSGYKARIGYASDAVSLLLPTRQDIFGLSYLTLNGVRYYLTRPLNGGVYTYDKEFAGSERIFDLSFTSVPDFYSTKAAVRELVMDGKTYSVQYNPALTNFYDDYPFTTLDVYFGTPVSSTLKMSLLEQLMPEMVQMSATERSEWLLKFMHKVFPYKTDTEQFGREKYFFAEEMFAYPYSDCEDRAVLYAYLVKSFADLSSIGLNYPGHVSTAIALPKSIAGSSFVWKNVAYTAYDPTYFGSHGGMTMPEYAGKSAEIVPVSENFLSSHRESVINRMIKDAGGLMFSDNRHIQLAEDGSVYACGYYESSFAVGARTLPNKGNKHAFVVKISPDNAFQWAVGLDAVGDNYPEQLRLDDNRLYLYGEYEGTLTIGDKQLQTDGNRDLFLANIGADGRVLWASKAGLSIDPHQQSYNYMVRFDSKGGVVKNNVYPLAATAASGGLAISPRNELILSGSLTTEAKSSEVMRKNAATTFAMTDYLKIQSDKYMKENTEKGVAGLFAVLTAICSDQMVVSGDDAVKALDKYNPAFKKRCPNIYENISGVSSVSNKSGILTLKTKGGRTLNFDKIQVADGCRMRVVKNGQAYKIEILDGMKVGKAFIWFKLNEMQLQGVTGNLVVDYDSDHTRRTFNLSKDILN